MTAAGVKQSVVDDFVDAVSPRDHCDDLLDGMRPYLDEDLPYFTDAVRHAFKDTPIFARRRYAEFFWQCASTVPGWLAQNVLTNAGIESDGSAKLLLLWKGLRYDRDLENGVLEHARDESRHSRLFLQIARRAFPHTIDLAAISELDRRLPDIRRQKHEKDMETIPEDVLMDHLVQMNIAEIRTRYHMFLMAPVICAYSPQEARATLQKILQTLAQDELRHISYTAKLLERWARSGDAKYIRELYSDRMHDFNYYTARQTEWAIQQYGDGRFPDLLQM